MVSHLGRVMLHIKYEDFQHCSWRCFITLILITGKTCILNKSSKIWYIFTAWCIVQMLELLLLLFSSYIFHCLLWTRLNTLFLLSNLWFINVSMNYVSTNLWRSSSQKIFRKYTVLDFPPSISTFRSHLTIKSCTQTYVLNHWNWITFELSSF